MLPPGTEMVLPRVTRAIPTKYATTLIHRDGVVATAVAYQELFEILEANGALESCCNDVLAWLRVAR
jgi:hypothetical protein